MTLALAAVACAAAPAGAQSTELWLDAAAAHARPPAGLRALDSAVLGWIGGRLVIDQVGPMALDLSAFGGRSAEDSESRWLTGAAGLTLSHRVGRWIVDGRAEWFGIDHARPNAYRAQALRFTPRIVRAWGPFTVSAVGDVYRGSWRLGGTPVAPGPAPDILDLEGDLRSVGGGLVLGRAVGRAWLQASVEVHDAINGVADGTFAALGTSGHLRLGPADLDLGAKYWRTPLGDELDLRVAAATRITPRVVAFASVEKAAIDRVFGAPRSITASVGVSWRVAGGRQSRALPIVEVAEPVGRGRRVRFQVEGGIAERVALAGSFTDWQPRPMRRTRDRWVLELVLEPGVHHFGFLLDGERWYVPDDAPGIVDDGWGQKNASFVIQEGP